MSSPTSPAPSRARHAVATASYNAAAVVTAIVAVLAVLYPGNAVGMLAQGLAALLAALAIVTEIPSRRRLRVSVERHPRRVAMLALVGLAVGVGFIVISVQIVAFAVQNDLSPAALLSALALVVTSSLDPFSRQWQYDLGRYVIRWARNTVILWSSAASLIVMGASN